MPSRPSSPALAGPRQSAVAFALHQSVDPVNGLDGKVLPSPRRRVTDPADVRPDHNGFRWLDPTELDECRFPPANEGVIARLTSGGGK